MSDIISAGAGQLAQPTALTPKISSLNDFLDLNKLAPPGDIAGLKGGLTDVGSKFKDLGAKFKTGQAAQDMLGSMEVPAAPNFDSAFSSLNDMMTSHTATLNPLSLGASEIPGSGALASMGLPSMSDFVGPVAGCPEIDALIEQGVTDETLTGIENMLARSGELFSAAGVDLDAAPVTQTLSSYMTAATSLHKIGAEANGAGAADMIKNLIPTGANANAFGDSIKVALAEGKNNKLMALNGIKPPQFNPFEGIPAGGDANLASKSAQTLLGGA